MAPAGCRHVVDTVRVDASPDWVDWPRHGADSFGVKWVVSWWKCLMGRLTVGPWRHPGGCQC